MRCPRDLRRVHEDQVRLAYHDVEQHVTNLSVAFARAALQHDNAVSPLMKVVEYIRDSMVDALLVGGPEGRRRVD